MADYSELDAAVAKFRGKSPNIAKACDELKKHSIRQDEELTKFVGMPALPPPPAPQTTCTQTISSGLSTAIQNASGGDVICLNSGSYGALTLTSLSKASTVTIKPVAGATVSIGYMNFHNVDHLHFTGTGGTMNIAGMLVDKSSNGGSDHLTFDYLRWTDGMDIWTWGSISNNNLIDSCNLDGLGISPEDNEGRITFRGTNESANSGWTVSNCSFDGGCSDGVQVIGDARGITIGPGNEFHNMTQEGCVAHVDPIQFYGAVDPIVIGNWFHDNGTGSGGIMSSDGYGNGAVVTNNVFHCTRVYNYSLATTDESGWTVQHNTFVNGGEARFTNGAGGNHVFDNVFIPPFDDGTAIPGSGFTSDHNLNASTGTNNVSGTPIFVGGANPTTRVGYVLASNSPGYHAGSDGQSMGIVS